ncbi:MAG: hypothetical protein PHZ25_01710 [Candidatus Pacebacteria bacterium]|jgi:hypothetical protein|nr:hypothetical protein [Candidatus Paceibacterota bacterium]
MFNDLTGLAYGIIIFAVIIGVGSIVLYNFGGATAVCTMDQAWNSSNNLCQTPDNVSNTSSPGGTSYATTEYLQTQLGTTGLAGWAPAVIAVFIGLLFLGAFMGKGKKKGRY